MNTEPADRPGNFTVFADFPYQSRISDVRPVCWSHRHFSGHDQIDQTTGHKQAVGILVQPTVTYLVETKDSIENQKRMFAFGPHLRFGSILGLFLITQRSVSAAFLVGKGGGADPGYVGQRRELQSPQILCLHSPVLLAPDVERGI